GPASQTAACSIASNRSSNHLRSTSRSAVASSAIIAAACTRLPTPWATLAGGAPPCRSNSHRRPHLSADSMLDGLTRTGSPASASGRSSDSGTNPHHSSGCAPFTPAFANRANATAALRRRGSGTVWSDTTEHYSYLRTSHVIYSPII